MCKVLAITNRKLCTGDFLTQIDKVIDIKPKGIVLREKDLSREEYKSLAKEVMERCNNKNIPCILHSYYDVALELGCDKIHVPLNIMKNNSNELKKFNVVGVSIHSVDEAKEAEKLGATYITAGHIFKTDCKKGVPPRGIEFLKEVCSNVNIPVFAIGGINENNKKQVIEVGAYGVCMMSSLMKI